MDWKNVSLDRLAKGMGTFLVFISVVTLCSVFFFEYVLEVRPCILCLYQRIPFYIGGGLGAVLYWRPKLLVPVAVLGVCLFALNVGIAGYNILVENGIMEGTAACRGENLQDVSIDMLKSVLATSNTSGLRACNDVSWTFFGIPYLTLAVANFLLSLGMAAVCGLVLAYALVRKRRGSV